MPHLEQVWVRLALASVGDPSRVAVVVAVPDSLAALDHAAVAQVVVERVGVANVPKDAVLLRLGPLIHETIVLALVCFRLHHVVLDYYRWHPTATSTAILPTVMATSAYDLIIASPCYETSLIWSRERGRTQELTQANVLKLAAFMACVEIFVVSRV